MICVVASLAISRLVYAQIDEFKIIASDGTANDEFGTKVCIAGDYAVVGARFDDDNGNNSGSAYVFKRTGTSWAPEAKLLPTDGADGDEFGVAVSISGDYVIVGARYDDNNGTDAGSAYVFKRTGTNWTQEAKLLPTDGAAGERFGQRLSISGDYAVVGAPFDDDNGSKSGSVYVFKRTGTSWAEEAKLLASDGSANDGFGYSVSISGDYTVVGAIGDTDNGTNSGSAYVFKRTGTTWTEEAKLLPSDGAVNDWFGYSVSIFGDYIVVSARLDDDNGSNSGSAYIFKRTGTNWVEEAKLLPSDGAAGDEFGIVASISGDYAVVGAWYDDDNGTDSGSAYLFKRIGTNWVEEAKLLPSDGAAGDAFGFVFISGTYVIVGAWHDDDNGTDSGSAYVYSGFGPIGVLAVSPASLHFSNVLVGETTTKLVNVSNYGIGDLVVSSIAITGIDSLNFSIDTTSFTLAPSDFLGLDVVFGPDAAGGFSASLDIVSDGGYATIGLIGQSLDPVTSIVSITDVPDDQGRWVFVSWLASSLDSLGWITQYGVWELNPDDEWISLGNVPAIQEEEYIYLAHTFGDSTDEGIFWSTFNVTAHTTNPSVFYTSAVDSGYSIDNLAPAVPTGLLASLTEQNTVKLSWDEPVDEDFNYFKIYRSLDSEFDPTGLEPYAEAIDTTFIDNDVETGETYYYILSAVDFNGNESEYTDAVETVILSIDDMTGIPTEFGLHQNYPNPFNPITTLRYDLPENSFVKITIYDLLGRKLVTLVSETQDAGFKSVIWNAANDHGKPVSAGVYLYQIQVYDPDGVGSREFVQTKKMIFLK